MIKINENYLKLEASYLFSEIGNRVAAYQEANPDQDIIKLGIGDVTKALPKACIEAMHLAVDEMADDSTFRGYPPGQGCDFLVEKIAAHDFQARGVNISEDEIFVSDGAKCDSANIQEIFSINARIAVQDPVYPVYVDTNVMAGRTGGMIDGRYENITYLAGTSDNGYLPELPSSPVDLIYLCFPNNPTGAVITKEQLKAWVDYAIRNKALILFDAAYEAYIRDESLPKSIYEVEGADRVAIELRSFSKNAGFTGVRCAYTVVPKACKAYLENGEEHSLHGLWERRQATKFNGVSYPVQRAAEAVYSSEGQAQVRELTDYYMRNAALVRKEMTSLGFECTGGENSPYIWLQVEQTSWEFFDLLLKKAGVVCTPGSGFGTCGEGHVRISSFNTYENTQSAMARIRAIFK